MRERFWATGSTGSWIARQTIQLALVLGSVFAFTLSACNDEPATPADRQIVKATGPGKAKGRGKGHGKGRGGDDDENQPKVYQPNIPAPKRTFFVSATAVSDGTGGEADPWRDLQKALCVLEPGDQVIVLKGSYRGPFTIDRPCKDGTAAAPIVVVAREDAVLSAGEGASALVLRRPFWIIQDAEIVSGRSRVPAVVIDGPDAHDILIDHVHMHNGWSDGIKVGREVRRLIIANSHIHNFGHPKFATKAGAICLDEGVAEITIVGNNIHQGLAGPIVMAGRKYGATLPDGTVEAPSGVTLSKNKLAMEWDGS